MMVCFLNMLYEIHIFSIGQEKTRFCTKKNVWPNLRESMQNNKIILLHGSWINGGILCGIL